MHACFAYRPDQSAGISVGTRKQALLASRLFKSGFLSSVALSLFGPIPAFAWEPVPAPPGTLSYELNQSNTEGGYFLNGSSSIGSSSSFKPPSQGSSYEFPFAAAYFVPQVEGGGSTTVKFGNLYASFDPILFVYKGVFDSDAIDYSMVLGLNDDKDQSEHPGGKTSCETNLTYYCPQVSATVENGQIYSLVLSVYSLKYNLDMPFMLYANTENGILVPEALLPELSEYISKIELSNHLVDDIVHGTLVPVWKGGTLRATSNYPTIGYNFTVDGASGNTFSNDGNNVELTGVISDEVFDYSSGESRSVNVNGNLNFDGGGVTTLSGVNTYTGFTRVVDGTLKVTGALSDETAITVESGATYQASSDDTIGSLAGAGSVVLDASKTLSAGANDTSTTFSGVISGGGSLTKTGSGTMTLSGSNTYTGDTTVSEGTLKLGASGGVPQASDVTVEEGGTFDLNGTSPTIDDVTLDGGAGSGKLSDILGNTATLQGGALTGTITSNGGLLSGVSGATLNVESGRTFIRDMASGTSLGAVTVNGGQLWAADDQTATVTNLTLNTSTAEPTEPEKGVGLPGTVNPGLVVGIGDKDSWAMNVTGTFTHTDGNVFVFTGTPDKDDDLDGTWNVLNFSNNVDYDKLFASTYLMTVNPDGTDYDVVKFGLDGKPEDDDALTRVVTLKQGSLKIQVGDVNPNLGEDDVFDPGNGFKGVTGDKGLAQDIAAQFPLMSTEDLSELVGNTMLPRNPDGPGRTLQAYNNLLTDTIFERTPLRQFQEVAVTVEEPAAEVAPEEPAAEPVRGLWSKSGVVDEREAGAYLEQQTAGLPTADQPSAVEPLVMADAAIAQAHQQETVLEVNGRSYVEEESLTAQLAERDGVRGWFRGFGGSTSDFDGDAGTVYTPFDANAGGGVVGVDVSVSESFQVGAYANYGNLQLWESGDAGSGSWDADGWGGGVTADYWTRNFYVQGLLGGSAFSGENKRAVKQQYELIDAGTARGTRSASTMVGAVRVGAPHQVGTTMIEPQFSATWTGNQQHRFSESGANDLVNLTYKSRTTNYLQTALGVKFAWPQKRGETGLLTPSMKVAWLGDWDLGNGAQRMGLSFTDKGYAVASNQENEYGALLEAGLDYSVLKLESTSVKAYVRGGAEVWGGERGTQWRASGGVTFQF